MQMMYLDYAIIALYISALAGVGFYFSRSEKNSEDFLMGGRNMPYLAVGISCMMALLSSISIVMIPGEIYNNGLTLFIFGIPGMLLAIPFYLLFMKFYFRLGSFTPYEYLEYRYDSSIRAVVAISAFYTRTMYVGMVLFTTAKIFEGAYNWPVWLTLLGVGGVGIIYTVMGGIKAVIWNDVLQFFILIGGFIVVIIALCFKIEGGAFEAIRYALAEGHGVPQFSESSFYALTPYIRLTVWLLLLNAILAPLTNACSDQISIQRMLTTRNWKEGFKAQIVNTSFAIPFILILWFVGMAVFTYYAQNPDPVLASKGGDAAFFRFVSTQLPSPFPGLFIAAMLAAIMSTLDSGLNSMATVWLKEIHQKFINKNLDQAGEVRVSRYATFFIGLFAVLLGLGLDFSGKWLEQSVSEVGTIFSLLGAVILPAFLFAVLSPRTNSKLIWAYALFSFGEGIGWNIWYVLSRASLQLWQSDPANGFGWAGKLPLVYFLLPLLLGMILCVPYAFKKYRALVWSKIAICFGLLILGATEAIGVWYGYSNICISDTPQARSFYFAFPISIILALIVLKFCPKQSREKYQGLTLGTINEPMLIKK